MYEKIKLATQTAFQAYAIVAVISLFVACIIKVIAIALREKGGDKK